MLNYNAPADGSKSSIDGSNSDQMSTFFWLKKSIIESRKEQYFMPLASVTHMPKHFGKTIKVHEYVPLLDDRNINDQGIDANGVTTVNGNLYGSPKDVGTIDGKLPFLTENGGRVNRVGFTRLTREGSLHKFGFFYEFTQESLDFDSDDMLKEHLSRELMNGAVQLTEAVLQKDLLAAAGVIVYAGAATDDDEITGEVVPAVAGVSPEIPASILSYANLRRLDRILTDNRTPRQTKVITGSRNIDTKTISSGRIAFIGSELTPVVETMKDPFNNKVFIEVQHYADAGTIMNGEIGSAGPFRFVEVPEMLHWAGVGAEVDTNPGYRSTTVGGTEHYDVFPVLVIGDESFTTIGFQTDGKSLKFSVLTKMPGKDTADRNEPFGETGFSSIKWYYGILILRPERIGLIKTVAPV
jgi:N4-gp56 family major capsid protein